MSRGGIGVIGLRASGPWGPKGVVRRPYIFYLGCHLGSNPRSNIISPQILQQEVLRGGSSPPFSSVLFAMKSCEKSPNDAMKEAFESVLFDILNDGALSFFAICHRQRSRAGRPDARSRMVASLHRSLSSSLSPPVHVLRSDGLLVHHRKSST